jgi:hypothetical protein
MNEMEWIPTTQTLPDSDKPCLVTCREWDPLDGGYGEPFMSILSFSPKDCLWNTKADVLVEAWMYLPEYFKAL